MSEDLIKRSDAIKAIEELPNSYNGWSDTYDKAYIIGTLEEVPSADRPQGKWIWHEDEDICNCSECKFEIDAQQVEIQVNAIPSIDIVRCKECIYYSDGECKCGLLPFSEYSDTANLWVTPKPDDFCSYGEREGE